MNSLVKAELDNLTIQFPGQSQINLDQYAELYKVNRKNASRHLRRRKIPATKEGHSLYISIIDLAIYKAKCKIGNDHLLITGTTNQADEMKHRRGFNQMADRRLLGK